MHETTQILIPSQGERIFNVFLLLYPESYGKQYGYEMQLLFSELYQEELARKGRVGLGFWFSQIGDLTRSIVEQHIDDMRSKGMKKYLGQTLHLNKFNLIGGLFLLPVFTVFCVDLISRILQRDLVHYNRPVYNLLSHTPLYWQPVLFTWIIVFPFLAVLINAIPLVKNISKSRGHFINMRFILQNMLSILLFSLAAFFIMVVKFHDFGPCMLHGLARLGFEHFTHIVSVCKEA